MRIVAIADTHLYDGELGALPEGDLLIHAGDMCRGGSLQELRLAVAWLKEQPHRHKVVVAGNHDWSCQREPAAARSLFAGDIVYLQDEGTELEGLRIWGSPWQPRFFDWAFNLSRGPELAAKWAAIPDDLDVLVTHGPPHGFGDRAAQDHQGCVDLLAAVRRTRPRLHIFGHIHEDGGLWVDGPTVLVNATTWEGERSPTVLDYDLRTREVTPIDVPER